MQPGTVLIVDDYADARASLREMLEELGHPVIEASNGREALDVLLFRRDARISLILLDLHMPVMDGWEFLDVVRSYVSLASIPVLVVSAYAALLSPLRQRSLVGAVQAPFELPKLRALVQALQVNHPLS